MSTSLERGAPRLPLLGFAPSLNKDMIGTMISEWRVQGDVVAIPSIFSGVPDYLIVHPEDVKAVLQEQHKFFSHPPLQRSAFSDVVGVGLVASSGSYWKRQRRLMQPMFHKNQIDSFAETVADVTAETAQRWRQLAKTDNVVDIRVEMMRASMTVLARCLFGAEWAGRIEEVGEHITSMLERTFNRMLSPIAPPEWVPTRMNRRFVNSRDAVDAVVYELITDTRLRGRTDTLVGMLLSVEDADTGEKMTDRQIRDEVMSMLIAGHETVSTGLTWTWYFLSKHPAIAADVRSEVAAVCGGEMPTLADLRGLDLTNRFILESMRLSPPLWITGRTPNQNVILRGVTIPAGSVLVLPQYLTHRHPDFWPNPEGFDPDRFTEANSAERHRYAYFPFGGGPRKCIGERFAMMEMPLLVAQLIAEFDVQLVPGRRVEPRPGISLRIKGGLLATIKTI